MEFTNAQIRDFAGSDEQYEKAKRLVDEQRIVSLDIDDFSSREIIMINATIKDGKNYRAIRDASGKMQFSWYRTTAFPLVCIYWVDRRKQKKGCLLA